MPSTLARLFNVESQNRRSEQLRDAISQFGLESGMFKRIDVKRLGKSPLDPFQLQVAGHGPAVNLVDVGYGVSQALPVVVEIAESGKDSLILLQQPEVHLHPRAQAALGTFFAKMIASLGNSFMLIETHSDYLIDRVRREIASGTIRPDDVAILFFDKPKIETTINLIELDDVGNVVNPPDSYRQFFLEEQLEMLQRGQ